MTGQTKMACLLIIAVLLGRGSAVQLKNSSCDFKTIFSLRSEWRSGGDPCHEKLPFELWALMKAEGSAQDADAQYARAHCFQTQDVGLVELITPEGYTMSEDVKAAPGDVVSETKHATSYRGATAATFEAFCEDENITRVTRVNAVLGANAVARGNPGRRFKSPKSEAGRVQQAVTPVSEPRELGCARTAGEDGATPVGSESCDKLGKEASGDPPQVGMIETFPVDISFLEDEEGSDIIIAE